MKSEAYLKTHPITPKGFFVFGLQRSGTNYVQKLMELNFVEGQTRAAWKHRLSVWEEEHLDQKIKERVIFVIHKHPYTWIESIAKRGGVDYVSAQTKYPAKEFDDEEQRESALNGFNVVNLARTWQEHYDNWVLYPPEYIKKDMVHVWYEDILNDDDRDNFLCIIRDVYGFTPKVEIHPIYGLHQWVNPTKVGMSGKFSEGKKTYYMNKSHSLTKNQVRLIDEIVS